MYSCGCQQRKDSLAPSAERWLNGPKVFERTPKVSWPVILNAVQCEAEKGNSVLNGKRGLPCVSLNLFVTVGKNVWGK